MAKVVTCLLTHREKLLILKRSDRVRTYRGLWGGVAGYVEPHEDPYETALKEIKEETGIPAAHVQFVKQGDPVQITDHHEGQTYTWIIHPFVFHVTKKEGLRLDWEHTAFKWIPPQDIIKYDTVPHFKDIVDQHLIKK